MISSGEFQAAFPAFGAILKSLSEGGTIVAVYDESDRLIYANAAFRRIFQLWSSEHSMTFADLILHCVERQCGPRIDRDDPIQFIADTQRRRRGTPGERTFATDMHDGRWFWMTETLFENGWITLIGVDFTEQKRGEDEARKARDAAYRESRTDALTGLPNRRHAFEMLEVGRQAFVQSVAPLPLSMALVDLDRFKQINDEFGHTAGDAVLMNFAEVCKQTLRRQDTVGRIGGEEFLVVLLGAPLDEAVAVLTLLQNRVSMQSVKTGEEPSINYSFSAGVTQFTEADTVDAAVRRADRALYEAKAAGRNCIRTKR
ncbi:diguanylate cyclase [Caballeronia sp. LZ032]|uniref:sensor domain-containing diguanylate cyclase n=1 Tax=Caballeronia sp. LZ032 TaxID=3038565 RepID=UPI002856CD11|nr:diguanylate cyclase [Caballeronia sp. LZ032]MDR5884015.1 diguanylate cyclase [Caballeronia sp. LZ032]